MKISLICPSRGRPQKAIRLLENLFEKSTNPEDIEFVFVFDDDDYENIQKIITSETYQKYSTNIKVVVTKRGDFIFSQLYNIGFDVTSNPIVGLVADDVVPRTDNWDEIVKNKFEEFPDHIFLLATDDRNDSPFATHFFTSRRAVEIMGFIQPPFFVADFGDKWVTEVFRAISRYHKTTEIVFEHMHYVRGKSPKDSTYEEASARRKSLICSNPRDARHPWSVYAETRKNNITDLQKFIDTYASDK